LDASHVSLQKVSQPAAQEAGEITHMYTHTHTHIHYISCGCEGRGF